MGGADSPPPPRDGGGAAMKYCISVYVEAEEVTCGFLAAEKKNLINGMQHFIQSKNEKKKI